MDAEEKKWNATGNRWWINIDIENENLSAKPIFVVFQKFLLPRGPKWPNLKDSGWRFNLWRITLTASYNIYNWTIYHPLSVLFFLSWGIMNKQIFTNMHSVCFSIFDTLVQPSVPGQTLSSHTSAGEPTTLWGVDCSDIEQPLWCNITRVRKTISSELI